MLLVLYVHVYIYIYIYIYIMSCTCAVWGYWIGSASVIKRQWFCVHIG